MRFPRPRAYAAGLLALAVVATGCTSGSGDDGDEAGTATSTGPTITLVRPSAPLKVSVEQPGDGVKPAQRPALKAALVKPVAAWLDGGFLDVEYPQSNFDGAFDSWTFRAAVLGVRDRKTTTNAELGPDLVAVVADAQWARLFVFAEKGKPGGATARVGLRFTGQREDSSLVQVEVKGEVYLTRKGAQWQIFGYDLTRTVAPA